MHCPGNLTSQKSVCWFDGPGGKAQVNKGKDASDKGPLVSLGFFSHIHLEASEAQRKKPLPYLGRPGFMTTTVLPEDVFPGGLARIGIALCDQGHGHSQAGSLEHQVFCREASVPPVHSKGEGEVLAVTHHLLAQELGWNTDTG